MVRISTSLPPTLFLLFTILLGETQAQPVVAPSGSIAIGGLLPDPAAMLDVQSTTKGFLMPRMTSVQRDGVANPPEGLMIYNIDLGVAQIWSDASGAWQWDAFVTTGSTFGWLTVGNGGLTDGINNKLGSLDPVPLRIIVGGTERLILNTNGSIQRDAGGNGRGLQATDLQIARSSGIEVASGDFSVISGGQSNRASSAYSVVGGGQSNSVLTPYSVVVGGQSNTVTQLYSAILGGQGNQVTNGFATVVGGADNSAAGFRSGIVSGASNSAAGWESFVGAGGQNSAPGDNSFVGAGYSNTAANIAAVVGGGENHAAGDYSAVVAGELDSAIGNHSAVVGGSTNVALGDGSFVGAGRLNRAIGSYSVVSGGEGNGAGNGATVAGGGSKQGKRIWVGHTGWCRTDLERSEKLRVHGGERRHVQYDGER
ncbi:MAG: hypothetical protein AB7H80_01890 [Candidatus Kapaibacterium sp.]